MEILRRQKIRMGLGNKEKVRLEKRQTIKVMKLQTIHQLGITQTQISQIQMIKIFLNLPYQNKMNNLFLTGSSKSHTSTQLQKETL
jgi:hypothetical protein